MNEKTVRADLDEIKFYYANQTEFDISAKTVGESSVAVKARKYNAAIVNAPAILYNVYVALYVNGCTQLDYATDNRHATSFVSKLNTQLCNYFIEYFKDDGI